MDWGGQLWLNLKLWISIERLSRCQASFEHQTAQRVCCEINQKNLCSLSILGWTNKCLLSILGWTNKWVNKCLIHHWSFDGNNESLDGNNGRAVFSASLGRKVNQHLKPCNQADIGCFNFNRWYSTLVGKSFITNIPVFSVDLNAFLLNPLSAPIVLC